MYLTTWSNHVVFADSRVQLMPTMHKSCDKNDNKLFATSSATFAQRQPVPTLLLKRLNRQTLFFWTDDNTRLCKTPVKNTSNERDSAARDDL